MDDGKGKGTSRYKDGEYEGDKASGDFEGEWTGGFKGEWSLGFEGEWSVEAEGEQKYGIIMKALKYLQETKANERSIDHNNKDVNCSEGQATGTEGSDGLRMDDF
jgi:hypothetical protein